MGILARGGIAAATAAAFLAAASPASATLMLATFTGAVDEGQDIGDFFGLGGVLDGASFTAVFKFDTTRGLATTNSVTDERIGGPAFGDVSPILSATLQINNITDVFDTFGNGSANVTNISDGWEQTFLYTDTNSSAGGVSDWNFLQLFVLSIPSPLRLDTSYIGTNKVFNAAPIETNKAGHFRTVNNVSVINYSASFITDQVELSRAAIPEPTTWALLIAGFGGVGAVLRRKRAQPA